MRITDEMPDHWVLALANAIEVHGWTIDDAHESGITINLTPAAMHTFDADPGEQLIIGWTERYGVDWGIGRADHVPNPETLPGDTTAELADAVHRLLTTGSTQ